MEKNKEYPVGGFAPGNYWGKCVTCKNEFQGDKMSFQCMICAEIAQAEYDALTEEQKQERIKTNLEAYNKFILELRSGK